MKKNSVYLTAVFAAVFMSCASVPQMGHQPQPEVRKQAAAEPPSKQLAPPKTDVRQTVLATGERYIDTPYVSPPRVPQNFDCSGFVSFVFDQAADMDLPTASAAYISTGKGIDFKDALPGDLLIFTSNPNGKQINHVAILYKKSETGELRGSRLLHAVSIPARTSTLKGAPDTTGVKITELGKRADGNWQQEYFLARFYGVRRVVEDSKE
ncbi:MAG: C40 family peptidase [Treponema sp.]|jgi:cell wall-associated NlpC family hydrolase|nr:C40 family peptidase [Treponema sp.]